MSLNRSGEFLSAATRLVTVLLAGVAFSTSARAETVVEEWVARYDGPDNISDFAQALAVDASGNVYVTGWSDTVSSGWDYATVKYDAAGAEV